jgi:hypothetical protein
MLRRLSRQMHINLIPRQTFANAVWVHIHFLVWQEVVDNCIFGPVAHKGLM